MMIIGCDYHPSWQQICWLNTASGETEERKLEHASGECEFVLRRDGVSSRNLRPLQVAEPLHLLIVASPAVISPEYSNRSAN